MNTTISTAARLLDAPADDANRRYETLAYLDAYDAVNDDDYAFIAWHETERATGAWHVRIQARGMAGAVFEPDAMRRAARSAAARGEAYFTWGAGITPSTGDPRQVEFRIHVNDDGRPASVEIFVVLRKADHSAAQPHSVRFAWPS